MGKCVRVHLLPSLTTPDQLADCVVVVIDILRATTTIIQALAAGAEAVAPCLEINEACEKAKQLGDRAVLGGERFGKPIDGFALGNSPKEYTSKTVAGKIVVFTTTNGTRAMKQCLLARKILLGAFVNFSAVCHRLATSEQVDLVCAGTHNQITREDVLFAGAVLNNVEHTLRADVESNDQGYIALDAWRNLIRDIGSTPPLAESLRKSHGGRNLIEIGLENDIEIAATIDQFNIVPELNTREWMIRVP